MAACVGPSRVLVTHLNYSERDDPFHAVWTCSAANSVPLNAIQKTQMIEGQLQTEADEYQCLWTNGNGACRWMEVLAAFEEVDARVVHTQLDEPPCGVGQGALRVAPCPVVKRSDDAAGGRGSQSWTSPICSPLVWRLGEGVVET